MTTSSKNVYRLLTDGTHFSIGGDFLLPVNCGSHADYQNFVLENLRKYYPNPDSIARSTWDIIDRFWNLDLSFTDEFMRDKYSRFGPAPRTPSCMQRSYLLSIDFFPNWKTPLLTSRNNLIVHFSLFT